MPFSLADLKVQIEACDGSAVALTMEIYAEAFPPGGDDANADAAARSFAAANGWTFLNRSDANFVIFFKREQD